MDNNNQNNQVQQQTTEPAQDPRLIQPEIIGELRKEKIGKPVLVIELFLLFGIVFASLPFINSQLTDENSMLYKFLHGEGLGGGGTVVTTQQPGNTEEEYLNGNEVNLLQSDSKIRFKNIILKDIQVNNNSISLTMYALTGTVNLDLSEYYLEVQSTSGNIIIGLKLTGEFDNVETPVVLDAGKVTFNSTMSYQGRIVEMKDSDYPSADLIADELGYAQMVCKKGTRIITYGFKNDYLIKINDEETVKSSNKDYIFFIPSDSNYSIK